MDSNPLQIGFESEFQKVKKTEKGEKNSNPFVKNSNPQGKISNRNSRFALRQRKTFCFHVLNILWLGLFLTKLKIRSKTFFDIMFRIILSSFTLSKMDRKNLTNFFSRKLQKAKIKGWIRISRYGFESLFQNVEKMDPKRHGFES